MPEPTREDIVGGIPEADIDTVTRHEPVIPPANQDTLTDPIVNEAMKTTGASEPIKATEKAMDLRALIARLHLSFANDKIVTQKSTERPVKEPNGPMPHRDKPVKGSNGSSFFENHLGVIGTEYEDEHDGHLSLPPLFRRSQTTPPTETTSATAITKLQDKV